MNNRLTTITRVLRSGITSKTLHQEIFDEVEIFVAIRRHGFSFMVADTVRSSEQAKYPLAAVAELSDAFGDGLAGSYDGGCKFRTSLTRSTVGPRALALNPYVPYAGIPWLCSPSFMPRFLARYIDSMGFEDLEGCKCIL
ncbi:hypothetical protein EDD15DRAFT_2183255 [Pisolithus albus]|nr:hypothetical protein EDD15DRAFT_2183251 [Pisolithus albus]KAI5981415.1 hypothetical protein EDD15DRAFT_2183255 [Pisolithus albus]